MIRQGPKRTLVHEETPATLAGGLIHSRWARREAEGNGWDSVVISGIFEVTSDDLELVYRPVDFSDEATTADVESFCEVYTRDDALTESVRELKDRIARLSL